MYLLCLYPAFATLLAIYVKHAIVRPAPARVVVHWLARLSGFAMLMLGSAALVALAMLVASPHEFADLLQVGNIRAPAFAPALASTVGDHWILSLAMPLAVVILGVRLIVSRPLLERMTFAIAAAMVFVTVAVNVVVVPSYRQHPLAEGLYRYAMKVVDDSPVGYLNALNYDVAFYSRRTIPIVSQKDPDLPQYLIAWRTLFDALPAGKRDRFDIVIDQQSNFARRHRRNAPAAPAHGFSNSTNQTSDDYIQAGILYDRLSRRICAAAFTSRGSTSADPPRKLTSQIRVISDS